MTCMLYVRKYGLVVEGIHYKTIYFFNVAGERLCMYFTVLAHYGVKEVKMAVMLCAHMMELIMEMCVKDHRHTKNVSNMLNTFNYIIFDSTGIKIPGSNIFE